LAAQIQTNRSWAVAPSVAITGTLVSVTHALITSADDAGIQGVIDAYAFDPAWLNPIDAAAELVLEDYVFHAIKGIIVLWSGLASAIPSGWVLCDGTNGTPDLRDRFIIGDGTGPTL